MWYNNFEFKYTPETKIMQYAVPQFTEVEDKLIGPLTLKQFLIALGLGGILFFYWSLFGIGIIFYMAAFPTLGIGIYIIFKKFNGRPFFAYLFPLINFMTSARVRIFKREPAVISFSSKQIQQESKDKKGPEDLEPAQGRLKKLAYLLDQKTEEEKDLIEKTQVFDAPKKQTVQMSSQEIIIPQATQKPVRTEIISPVQRRIQELAKSLSGGDSIPSAVEPPKAKTKVSQ
ncbi:MAG TPA: hypothetical protein VD998_01965, partial [Verrucomicrobiae bacterium]|nr:hypothetical protein [Verrucomicrobiae bacterium]